MITDQQNIEKIKELFGHLKTKEDFLALLNFAKSVLFNNPEDTNPIELKSLTYYANPKLAGKRYICFAIKKKSGGTRTITSPVGPLKTIQRCLNFILSCVFEPHKAATGFVPGKSIKDNAALHIGKYYVYNIDLKDFFPSVELHRIKAVLKLPPFNLVGEKEPLAFMIANLCCTDLEVEENGVKQIKGVLPQGAPTSPVITNIICQKLDRRLSGLAKRFGATYSRYADDITFSSFHNLYSKEDEFLKELNRIIADQHFRMNEKKTRLQKIGFRQEVTGLTVNEKTNVAKRYIKTIRIWLHIWEKHGFADAEKAFLAHYKPDKGHIKKGRPDFINVLSGKLEFLKMVRGHEDLVYLKYCNKFSRLLKEEEENTSLDLNRLLYLWETKGIDAAMGYFNQLNKF